MLSAVLVYGIAMISVATNPKLPDNFDPKVNMVVSGEEEGMKHSTRGSAELAGRLIEDGSPEAVVLALKVLDAVLGCQELHHNDAHYGNFKWSLEDEAVEDLNAVEFTLSHLIPMMLMFGDRVPQPMHDRVLESIRLGLDEIKRLDVSIAYTNITSLDVLNSCLAGVLLKDDDILQRGNKKLLDWIAFTNTNGTVYEFNSPTYMGVTLDALYGLAMLSPDNATRVRARTFAARLGLSSVLRIHPEMGRWAGPHSRAYSYTSFATGDPEIKRVRRMMKQGLLPEWVSNAIGVKLPLEIRETSGRLFDFTQTTYLSASFSLGVASRELIDQSNCFIAHYKRPATNDSGVVFSRYVINDERRGREYDAGQFFDAGQFYGVQDKERAIALYAPPLCIRNIFSAKAILMWPSFDTDGAITIGCRPVTELPAEVKPGEVVVIDLGAAWMAVLPLKLKDFSHDAPIRLLTNDGALVMEMHNYLGPEKLLWEMEWPGGFYKGRPQCGFYSEFAEKAQYSDAKSFAAAVAAGAMKDEAGPALSYDAAGKRLWQVEYARDNRKLGIEVDLYQWTLERRWTQNGDMDWPLLDCEVARETNNGRVEVAGAILEAGTGPDSPAWLFASPEKQIWVAGYLGTKPAPLKLILPAGSVSIEAMGTGTVVWENGTVKVDAIDITGAPTVIGGTLAN